MIDSVLPADSGPDWLDDIWDATIRTSQSDPALIPILRTLRAIDPAPAPDPRWLNDLEERLMHTTTSIQNGVFAASSHQIVTRRTAQPPRETAWKRNRPLAPFATAAVLLVTILVGLVAIRGSQRPPHTATIPVPGVQPSVIADLQNVSCTIDPWTSPLPTGTPTTTSLFPLPINGEPQEPITGTPFPTWSDADRATIDGIATTLAELYACQSVGETDRVLGLFSGDLYRRTDGQPLQWSVPAPDAYRLDMVMILPDGRAMTTLVEPSFSGAYIVFAKSADRWLIDEVAVLRPSPIPTAETTPVPTCSAPSLPADLAPPPADIAKPDGLFPFDANQDWVAGPFTSDVLAQPPYLGDPAESQIVTEINQTLTALQDCSAVDDAARSYPDRRKPVEPPTVLAFFSSDLLARGRIAVLPNPWWDAYPISFGWTDWQLPAREVRQLPNDRLLVLLDSTTSATDHAALVMVAHDGRWLIDEVAYLTDDPAALADPASDCSLPAPTTPRAAPDWAKPLTYQSVLPLPLDVDSYESDRALTEEQLGRTANVINNYTLLPTGTPVDATTRAGVAAAITDWIGCRDVDDFPQRVGRDLMAYQRAYDLGSDDLFRRFQPDQPLPDRWWDSFRSSLYFQPRSLDSSFLDSLQTLPDGRVIGILTADPPNTMAQVLVLVEENGQWKIDEFAWLGERAPATPISEPRVAQTTVLLSLADIVFTPNQITVPADQEVTITLINQGQAQHSFVVPDLNINQPVAPGESINIRLTAPAGAYRFICDVPGHEEAGMVGLLTVVDAESTPVATT